MHFFSKQEEEILTFIGEFGRTYIYVLGRTFFNDEKQSIAKIHKMKKKGFIKRIPTKLNKPRNAIILTKIGKDYLHENNIKTKKNNGNISHLNHNMNEQIAFFHLSKLGDVIRTSVWHHKNVYYAVPDLVLCLKTMNIAIEIEMTQKSSNRYQTYVKRAKKDLEETGNINRFLCVTPNKKLMTTIANSMPIWDKLQFIDIDTLIKNIEEFGDIKPFTQEELYVKKESVVLEKNDEKTNLNKEIAQLKNILDDKEKECVKKIEKHEKEIRQKNDEILGLKTTIEKYRAYFTKIKKEQNKSFFAKIFKKIK